MRTPEPKIRSISAAVISGTTNIPLGKLVGFSIPEKSFEGRSELSLAEERLHLGPTRSGSLKSIELCSSYVNR